MKIRFKGKHGAEERSDVVHVVPLSIPETAGIKFRDGTITMLAWTDILKIEND